jgi:hypothetical protein
MFREWAACSSRLWSSRKIALWDVVMMWKFLQRPLSYAFTIDSIRNLFRWPPHGWERRSDNVLLDSGPFFF